MPKRVVSKHVLWLTKKWSMEELNISVITIYMTIKLKGCFKSGRDMQGLDRLYNKTFAMSVTIQIFKKAFYGILHHLAYESRRNLVLHQNQSTYCHDGKKYQIRQKEILSNCWVKNQRMLSIQFKQSSRAIYMLIFRLI